MKRFVLRIALFFAIVACIDNLSGYFFEYLSAMVKGGFTYRDNYICNQLETDVLLCGSSRCVRHYNPEIISDSLGLSCYNAGQMGNGIILSYGRLLMINERKAPKIVVYDVTPEFDLLEGEDNHRYLTWLKPHYDRNGIADILYSVDPMEKYKMRSKLYRYNSRILELLADCFQAGTARSDGFEPLQGLLDKSKIRENMETPLEYEYDPLKLDYLNYFIDQLKDSRLVFVVSPKWYGMDSHLLEPLADICKKRSIEFYDFSNSPKYVHNDEFFKDGNHMNANGADEFSRDISSLLLR